MSFGEYLISKKRFLIFYFMFHSTALFINLFNIEGSINDNTNLLTTEPFRMKASEHFWPVVDYTADYGRGDTYFHGVFYNYDISEFLAYGILIFVALYFYYENKPKSFKK